MYFGNTTNLNCWKKIQMSGLIVESNMDFIVLPKYIFPENYQKSECRKQKSGFLKKCQHSGLTHTIIWIFIYFYTIKIIAKESKSVIFV